MNSSHLKQKIAEGYVIFGLCFDRGKALFSIPEYVLKFTAYSGAALLFFEFMGIEVPMKYIKFVPLLVILVYFAFGLLDMRFIKMWQFKNNYTTTKLTPYFKELKDQINRIEAEQKKCQK